MRGGGQRPYGIFPGIHPILRSHPSLTQLQVKRQTSYFIKEWCWWTVQYSRGLGTLTLLLFGWQYLFNQISDLFSLGCSNGRMSCSPCSHFWQRRLHQRKRLRLRRKKESGHHRQCGFYSLLSSVKVNSSKICQISLILRHLLNKIYCAKFHCNCAKFHLNCAIFHWRFSRILPNSNCANFHWYCAIFN